MTAKFKVSFELDESDATYFRGLYRKARRGAKQLAPEKVIADARDVVKRVRSQPKTPRFVVEAISVLADLADLVVDEEYAAPRKVRDEILAGIAYFSNPEDLIPDHVPGLGFLDDAIMVKFIEDEFQHELWGYRKFRKQRDVSEQRPWSSAGRARLKERLENDRKKIRAEISKREAREAERKRSGRHFGW